MEWLRLLSDAFHHWPRRSVLGAGLVVVVALTVWSRPTLRSVPEPPPSPPPNLSGYAESPQRSSRFSTSAPAMASPRAVEPSYRASSSEESLEAGGTLDSADEIDVDDDTQTAAASSVTPAVIRTATLRIVVKSFDTVRTTVEEVVTAASGFIGEISVSEDTADARSLHGTLKIPSARLAQVSARLRRLGQVVQDTQGSEDVTDQVVDFDARLSSARTTESRLIELLRNRTGKLTDVLAVERELARVRVNIERLTAAMTNIARRVTYATLQLDIVEERKPQLAPGPLTFSSRVRVAVLDGLANALISVESVLETALRIGPVLVLWALVLGPGVWLVLRRLRSRQTAQAMTEPE